MTVHELKARPVILRILAVLIGALFMIWPALYDRYPLFYPDSVTYVQDGALAARAVFLHKFAGYYGMRSLIYSLGILSFHWGISPWPIVALQALLTAYVLWLVVRSILPDRTVTWYLILIALLSLVSSLSWFVSLVMPDILGALLYLCAYLLVFARERLSRIDCVALGVIAWWSATSHATHLILLAGLCVLLVLLRVLWRQEMRGRRRGILELAGIALLAAGAQLALNFYLYGQPSLNGDRPPFLMARLIADGPGRWYLEQHCPQTNLVICDFVHDLPDDSDAFIWAEDGIWQNVDDDVRKRMLQEELPFVLATLRAYPRAQLLISARNSRDQLRAIGLYDLDASDYVLSEFDKTFPGGKHRYLDGRQAKNLMPLDFFSSLQKWAVLASLAVIAAFMVVLWRQKPFRLLGLGVVIVSVVAANAFVTGALSTVEDRYESRVIWLLPLLAGLLVMHWFDRRAKERRPGSKAQLEET